jgi:ubiquinone/menaquinone biosynthesis C-methylase UbiE
VNGWAIAAVLAAAGAIAAVLYWQLGVAEGAYLGRRVVALLYDWHAPRYDQVKQFDPRGDAMMLALPVLQQQAKGRLPRAESPRAPASDSPRSPFIVVDVATGTGRLPMALLQQPAFRGQVAALDLSSRMLDQARLKTSPYAKDICLLQGDAQRLPFPAESADVVACLEAAEFFPDPPGAVRELARLLKPGGLLLISNRVGPDAWKLPGRAMPTPRCADLLRHIGLADVQVMRWLVDYDLLSAVKPGNRDAG